MKFSRFGSFCLGLMVMSLVGLLAVHFLGTRENFLEKFKVGMILICGFSLFNAFIFQDTDLTLSTDLKTKKAISKKNQNRELGAKSSTNHRQADNKIIAKDSSKNSSSKKRSDKDDLIDIPSSSEDIQHLLNEMSQKTMQANDLIFNRQLDLQTKSSIDLNSIFSDSSKKDLFPKKEMENLDLLRKQVSRDIAEQTETGIKKIQETTGIHKLDKLELNDYEITDPKRRAKI